MCFSVISPILGIILFQQSAAAVVVRVEQGRLRGEQLWTITGNTLYYSFKGIPYAAPPIGKLRFKAPQPALAWRGIRNATEHGNVCPQFHKFRNISITGSEDCLFLNVYTPCLDPHSLLPVFFVIHGGGFTWGSGNDDMYGPDFLIDERLVVVTINYRLDNLGFLCLDTPEVPGNAGMKDQVAALRWVQRNIENFGGDPSKVTVYGQSAGSMSTTFHTMSPMSRGLFRRVIASSGVARSEFTIEFEPKRRAFVLAKNLGVDATNTTELLEFLQGVPAERLVNVDTPVIAAEHVMDVKLLYSVPVVEKDFGQERFLIEPPDVAIKKGRCEVDILLGFNSAEAVAFIPELESSGVIENYNNYPEVLVPRDIFYQSTPKMHLKLADFIRQYYTGSKEMPLETIPQCVAIFTNAFIYSIITYAGLLSKYSRNKNIYLYEFTCMSERNIYSKLGYPYGIHGVAHCDDLMYIFNAKFFNLPLHKDESSYKMVQRMCALLANFTKHGNPTPDRSVGVTWPRYHSDSRLYMDIGEALTVCTRPRQSTVDFYDLIYKIATYERKK